MNKTVIYNSEVAPFSVSMTEKGIQNLSNVFERMVVDGLHPTAQMVVLRKNKVVFDKAIGTSRGRAVTPDTPFLTFSCTKAFTAICVHKLIEEGKVEMDAPVAEYWPEFGVKGKETATIRHVFLHQAGIPWRHLQLYIPLWPVWSLITKAVAGLKAEYQPGSKVAYHAVNFGFILGEVIRRVAGIPIEDYFRENFTQPLGMANTWMRIPRRELRRSPRIFSRARDQLVAARFFNISLIRRSVNPAATMHSTARDMAVFYQMLLNGGEYNQVHYLNPKTIQDAVTLGYQGWDYLFQRNVMLAYGLHLGGNVIPEGEPGPVMGTGATARTYGHFGNRSCMAWADPDAKLVVAFTCNRLLGYKPNRSRWTDLSNAVWEAVERE
jgi:CubicO group peptidase (beta-lactamase class C family)